MDGNDLVIGTDAADLLAGGEGEDVLVGGQGDDFISGDADFIDAGAGDDILRAGSGNSQLSGGPGNDTYEISGSGTKHLIDSQTNLAGDSVFFIEPDGTKKNLAGLFIATSDEDWSNGNVVQDTMVYANRSSLNQPLRWTA